eukprot:jgi/Astpho2/6465/Aster-06934
MAVQTQDLYKDLEERLQELSNLSSVSNLLRIDAELGRLLQGLGKQQDSLQPLQAAVLREANRSYVRTKAISRKLAKRKAELESEAYQAWVKARTASDWSLFAPCLEEWVDLIREQCAAIDPTRPAYDVCLDEFEKGMTTQQLDKIFAQVREGLVPLIANIKKNGTPPDRSCLSGSFDKDTQAKLCHSISQDLGFDLEAGRLDVSVHPFSMGVHPTDVRMTTRFKEDDVTEGLTGAVHETGHTLYEQGRNLEHDGLPVNEAMSMGVHESQSLLWERMYLLPKLEAAFPQLAKLKLPPEQLYGALNVVRDPSMIRVEADEVTYPLHIILRYELERQLLDGKVTVNELPALWNERMTEYLGCTPRNDAEGILQDVHWSAGIFGYFPTYSLGAMYACQIFETAWSQLPDLDSDIAKGNFAPLKKWLNEHIHKSGSFHANGEELMKAVTGSPLNPEVFLKYLRQKYSALYKC